MTKDSREYATKVKLLRKKRWRFWLGTPICFAIFCILFTICLYLDVPHLEFILVVPFFISCIFCLWGVISGRCPECSRLLPAWWHWTTKPKCRVCGPISLADKTSG
ncbi:MAG: hypothetical protein K8F52_11085 [Candidatus Scalindua rubra]|uniref:Uncharacterized protein n=1 Tax=Candidatus Scalindua brodae TaxID=237368 RepID=A0A0B0EIS6_9BACT|nr:MAG: hypothetical protein SCABRO_02348 [Candidatus Scalindua brodae]MBZ0109204.1 hypothetical protein [Candidatus Scalindua rubra]